MSLLDHRQAEVNDTDDGRLVAVHLVAQRSVLAEQHLDTQQRVAVVGNPRAGQALIDPDLLVFHVTQELTTHTQSNPIGRVDIAALTYNIHLFIAVLTGHKHCNIRTHEYSTYYGKQFLSKLSHTANCSPF